MEVTSFISTLLVTVAMGAAVEQPRIKATMKPRALNNLCPPLDTPLCCETVVEGTAGLTCESPSPTPKNDAAFKKICAKEGMGANCCTLDVDGTGLVCSAV